MAKDNGHTDKLLKLAREIEDTIVGNLNEKIEFETDELYNVLARVNNLLGYQTSKLDDIRATKTD